MTDRSEFVHAHRVDAARVIEEYRQRGYVLKERTKPSVLAQAGFEKLVFIPEEDFEACQAQERANQSRKRFWFLR